jgi:hypothetical protein
VDTAGTYEIATVDAPSALDQALVLQVGVGELWIEHLTLPQVIVRIVRPRQTNGERTVLLASGPELAVVKGIAHVRRTRPTSLRVTWADTTRPSIPERVSAFADGGTVTLAWGKSTDYGSGVRGYRVRIDGRRVADVEGTVAVVRATAGRRHVAVVTAVDRAGRESRPALRRFRGR